MIASIIYILWFLDQRLDNLVLFGTTLGVDELKFAYQPGCSASMCTWMVTETVRLFLRNGFEVFICAMNMNKDLSQT